MLWILLILILPVVGFIIWFFAGPKLAHRAPPDLVRSAGARAAPGGRSMDRRARICYRSPPRAVCVRPRGRAPSGRRGSAGARPMSERIYLYDTTLRDGGHTQGVDFSVADKVAIAGCSISWASTTSKAAGRAPTRPTTVFSGMRRSSAHARLAAFGMTRRAGRSAANDPGLAALFQAAPRSSPWSARARSATWSCSAPRATRTFA